MQSNESLLDFLRFGCLFSSQKDEIKEFKGEYADEFYIGWSKIQPNRGDQLFSDGLSVYAPDFFLEDQKPWWNFQEFAKVTRDELLKSLNNFLLTQDGSKSALDLKWQSPSKSQFEESFSDLQSHIQRGDLKKGVPVVFEKATCQVNEIVKASWIIRLLNKTRGLPICLYGLWNLEQGILGGTPELLFESDSNLNIMSAALAGTRIKGSLKGPLLEDPKEMEEHRMVIDGICTSLAHLGRVIVHKTQELSLPTLSHLWTPLTLITSQCASQLSDFNSWLLDMIKSIHPTPALGAFPKSNGAQWLKSQDRFEKRYRFGAPFGVVGSKTEFKFVVAIRNLQWLGSHLYLGAGCGIIGKSILENEWQEIQGKIQSVKNLFQL